MTRSRLSTWTMGAVLGLAAIYIIAGSWVAASMLDRTLEVGAATAQSSGWPAPRTPADIGYAGNPQTAYGYAFDEISLPGELGDLPAWLIPPAQKGATVPWAIFVHGIGGRRENGYRFLPVLHRSGFSVLMISYRNDADALADPSGLYTFGLTEWRDLDTAVRHAIDNGASSVILVAESMGGGVAGQFLRHSEISASVSAIVLDAPAINVLTIVKDQIERMNLPLAPVLARGALWFSGLREPARLSKANVTDEFATFKGPLFVSHGFADSVVPIKSSDEMVSERGDITEYLRTGSDHIQSWKVNPARYEAALSGFLLTLQPPNTTRQ